MRKPDFEEKKQPYFRYPRPDPYHGFFEKKDKEMNDMKYVNMQGCHWIMDTVNLSLVEGLEPIDLDAAMAYARDAEHQMSVGNPPCFEVTSSRTSTRHVWEFEVPEEYIKSGVMNTYRVRVCQTHHWDVKVSAPNEREAEMAAESEVEDNSKNAEFLYHQTDTEFVRCLND